jgi:hypothetical protein
MVNKPKKKAKVKVKDLPVKEKKLTAKDAKKIKGGGMRGGLLGGVGITGPSDPPTSGGGGGGGGG